MSIEADIATSIGLTLEELKTQQIAASIGMTLRAKQAEVAAVAELTPQELEVARRFRMTPEDYADQRAKDMPPEEVRRCQVELLRQSANGPYTEEQRASILRAADELEVSPLESGDGD